MGGADFSKEFEVLHDDVMRRTFRFRIAWAFSVAAVVIPLVLVFVRFCGTSPVCSEGLSNEVESALVRLQTAAIKAARVLIIVDSMSRGG